MRERTKRETTQQGPAERPPGDRPGRATRTAKTANERAARGLPARQACCVRRTPARGAGASAEAGSGARERRARSGEKTGATAERPPGARPRTENSESAPRWGSPHAACAAPHAARITRPLVVRAPPPARLGAREQRVGGEDERKRRPIHTNIPRAPPAQLRRLEPPDRSSHAPASAPRGRRPSRCALARARSIRSGERREDATRRDRDLRNTTRLFHLGDDVFPRQPPDERASARRLRAAQAPHGAGARWRGLSSRPPRFWDALRGDSKKRVGAVTYHDERE